MIKDFNVHIFCKTPSLCKLIIKSFPKSNFKFECTNVEDLANDGLEKLNIFPDCIVLDKEINPVFRDKIKCMFPNIDIIYLPSLVELDTETPNGNKHISEPLKLSELGNALNEVFEKKKNE